MRRNTSIIIGGFLCITALIFVAGKRFSPSKAPPAPYPRSTYISGVSFDMSTLVHAAPGSDLWFNTWASDDNIYVTWGDGGGFGGTNRLGRVSTGAGRISGKPPGTYTNINGGFHSLYPATFDCFRHAHCGKLGSILAIENRLYSWFNTQNRDWTLTKVPDIRIASSTDYGKTWTTSKWVFSGNSSGIYFPECFLQMGRGYGGNDGYVYSTVRSRKDNKNVYLTRVRIENITDNSKYEFYNSLDPNNPHWGPMTTMKPIFTDPNSVAAEGGVSVTGFVYNTFLDRYIITEVYGSSEKLGIFEGTHPWGPWKTVAYYADWLGFADKGKGGSALSMAFSNKWSGRNSSGSVYLWMIFSCYGCAPQYHDRFNLIKATFLLGRTVPR